MSGVAWHQDVEGKWDIVTLGGERFTGAVTFSGSASRKLEMKGRRGFDGRVISDAGYQNADVDISISVATKDDFDRLQKLLGAIHPRKKGGTKKPITIGHPAPNLLGIFQVYVHTVGIPSVSNGILTLGLKATEWIAVPKKKVTKPTPKGAETELDDGVSICAVDPSPKQAQSGTSEALACTGAGGGCMTVDLESVDEQFMQDNF